MRGYKGAVKPCEGMGEFEFIACVVKESFMITPFVSISLAAMNSAKMTKYDKCLSFEGNSSMWNSQQWLSAQVLQRRLLL